MATAAVPALSQGPPPPAKAGAYGALLGVSALSAAAVAAYAISRRSQAALGGAGGSFASMTVAALSAAATAAATLDTLVIAERFRRLPGATVCQLYRYPIKSLTREQLESVRLEAGGAFPGDREWAIMRGAHLGLFDPQHSCAIKKTKFHVMMLDEKLAALNVTYDAQSTELVIRRGVRPHLLRLRATLGEAEGRTRAEAFFVDYLGEEALEPAEAGDGGVAALMLWPCCCGCMLHASCFLRSAPRSPPHYWR